MSTHLTHLSAAGCAALLAAGLVGCTADAAPPSPVSSAAAAAVLVSLPSGDGAALLEPGRYVFPVLDAPLLSPVLPVVAVPPGFAATDDAAGVTAGGDARADGRMLRIWDVDSVYSHPCDPSRRTVAVGPTAADLADALAAQPMRAGTDPVPVTIGGYDGFYVELSVPEDVDIAACPGGKFFSWPGRWQQAPGQVDMLWIVDAEGQRVVFDAWALPGSSPQERTELQHMVTTATFVPSSGS
ncbi:hypothetical protein [Cellulomonas sp. P5_C6]